MTEPEWWRSILVLYHEQGDCRPSPQSVMPQSLTRSGDTADKGISLERCADTRNKGNVESHSAMFHACAPAWYHGNAGKQEGVFGI